ncbi:quinolinate phosphoribosyltransferase-like protein [Campylobacter iguaniorum]|uniref:molybdenum ABC transporter n=1 Tax=Campylobacter iguaniorum TaxID=1244531 RepID=UPI00073A4C9C|nr:molybdenum ABC transporter [Campylobacter iguaniorum]ALV23944.1 quinolinate phosphoribosyltransferase-like protein [Campylobacter iguaniorum]
MIKFTRSELESLIENDAPFDDLTTDLLGISKLAKLRVYTRSDITLSCLDAVSDISNIYNLDFKSKFTNSKEAKSGDELLEIIGDFGVLHRIYKSIQNLLEYACGIATKANLIVKNAKSVNPNCEVLVTRKVFPFAKKLCLKAALEGGVNIHRTGLSDSVLFFSNHTNAYDNLDNFFADIAKFKAKLCERKIMAESESLELAKELLKAGIDGVQCDKMSVEDIANLVKFRDKNFQNAVILAAGGIDELNAADYAQTDINAIVTSAVYKGIANLGAKIELI